MDALDIEILYKIAEAQQKGQPVSTWQLASMKAGSSTDRNRLDSIIRYRLKELAKAGIAVAETVTKGKQKHTAYVLNPQKILCHDGQVIILANPITILACPHVNTCKSNCNIQLRRTKGKTFVVGCKLLQEAPDHIKDLVYEQLEEE